MVTSSPVGDFNVVIKKSIVLYCGGFHLNEYSHVILVFGPAFPITVDPTPNSVCVNIRPSVSYSNKSCFSFSKIALHPSNMDCLEDIG